MTYGHFDDAAREYVITRPDTPRSWSNYLGSTTYGAIITNNAGGYSFYQSAMQGRFTRLRFNAVPMDQPGRYFYLRDNASGDYWSASWQPVGKPLDQYTSVCRHGTAYTVIESRYSGIVTQATYFVPLGRNYEVWVLDVRNDSDRPRELGVYSYVEYASEWHALHDQFNLQYSQYILDCRFVDGLISHAISANLPADPERFENRDQSRHTFMGLVGAPLAGFDTDREAFIGPYRTYSNPIVVERGQCTGSEAHGDNGCGTLQVELSLRPGESHRFLIVMGVGQPGTEGRAAMEEMGSVAHADAALRQLKDYWHARLSRYSAQTPDKALDSMVNVWNAYNALITFTWSRAASLVYTGERDGLGYRDTVQDMLGAISLIPDEARNRLELMVTGQVSTGGAMSLVKQFSHRPGQERTPGPDHYRSDDSLWLFNAVPQYVKETGDLKFLEKPLPYADSGQATVLGHLRRAIEFNLERRGAHALPCGLQADWNDCLKLGQRGESVMVAFQLRYALICYREICLMLKRDDDFDWARQRVAELDKAIQRYTWDGGWFIRAYREDGSIIGTRKDPEGSIFLNAQAWAVISGAASPEQSTKAMDAVKQHLATPYGIELCAPPFVKTDYHVVRAVLFNPGMKENGGIFSHPQSWAVIAETMLGRGTRAYEYYRAYMPSAQNEKAELRQIEPYVHCQSTHGRASRRYGASRLPWLSGTATWSYVAATQYILGVRPEYAGLLIDPCIPAAWDGFSVRRQFRGATYAIKVENPDHVEKGLKSLTANGREIEPARPIPPARAGEAVEVRAVMGG